MPIRVYVYSLFCSALMLSTATNASVFDEYFIDPEDGNLDASRYLSEVPFGFLPVPAIITEPAVGTGLGLAAVFFHETDEQKKQRIRTIQETQKPILPANISVLGLMGTDNGTKGAAVGHLGFWKQDRIRYRGAILIPSLNLDFYSLDQLQLNKPVELNLEGPIVFQEIKFRPTQQSNIFLGARQIYRKVELSLANGESFNPFNSDALNERLHDFLDTHANADISTSGLGVLAEYDSRNNPFNPESGYLFSAHYDWFSDWMGSDAEYHASNLTALNYWPFADQFIFSLRAQYDGVDASNNDPLPPYTLPFIDLRGVPKVRYQSNRIVAIEAQFDWKASFRWKYSFFTGTGRAAEHMSDLNDAEKVNTYGAGFRYLAARRYGFAMGLDIARGPEETTFYIQAGSAW